MKSLKTLVLLLALGLSVHGQAIGVKANKIKGSSSAPSGSCSAQDVQLTTAGVLWTCQSGTWASAGASSSFSSTVAISPAVNTSGLTVSGYSLTGSNAQSLVDLAGTWNTSGTPTAWKLNITDTASNAASFLARWQIGGSDRAVLYKNGAFQPTSFGLLGGGTISYVSGFVVSSASAVTHFMSTGPRLGSNMIVGWNSSASDGSGSVSDVALGRLEIGGLRVTNASTGAGNLAIAPSTASMGTGAVGALAIGTTTAPASSPADLTQIYTADAAAGDNNLFMRNEAGEIARVTGLTAYVTSQFDKTSDTTLANVSGLTRNVAASTRYSFEANLMTSSNASGGIKCAMGGTATATSLSYDVLVFDNATLAAQGRGTTLGSAVAGVTAVTAANLLIRGTILVNAAGTLTVQCAQNASNGTASSVLVGSSLKLTQQ